MTAQFKIGDVVTLKSSSPFMTVSTECTDNRVFVCWHCSQTGAISSATFHADMLDLEASKNK